MGYCAQAGAGYDALQAYFARIDSRDAQNPLGGDPGDHAIFAAEAELALAQLLLAQGHWDDATASLAADVFDDSAFGTSRADALAAYDAFATSVDIWMLPEARLAAASSSIEGFSAGAFELVISEGVASEVSTGALATQTILLYQLERCGTLSG